MTQWHAQALLAPTARPASLFGAMARARSFVSTTHALLLVKTVNARKARQMLPKLMRLLEQFAQSPAKTLAATLKSWIGLVGMWRFSKSNGITGILKWRCLKKGMDSEISRITASECWLIAVGTG